MLKKIINDKWFYFVIIFLFMLVFNFMTPYLQDDFILKYIFNTDIRVSKLKDIIVSLKEYYFTWGGRVLAHFFAYFFLILPKWVFNIVNSIVYVLNVYLIYLIGKGNKKDNYKYLLLIHMIIFIFFPAFGQVFLWLDGSCNYSFTLLFQLLFIYKILNIEKIEKKKDFIYFIISLLAGMCNENSSLSLIVFLVLYTLYDRSNLKLKITSLISLIIGYLFMFLAPGNYVRMDHEGINSFISIINKLYYLIIDFWPLILCPLLLIIIYRINKRKINSLYYIYYISGLVSFFVMIFPTSFFTVRSLTLPIVFICIIFVEVLFNINSIKFKKLLFIFISILFIVIYYDSLKETIKVYKFMKNRESLIIEAVSNNEKSIRIKEYKQSYNCRVVVSCKFVDIRADRNDFPNYYMGKYYGIDIYGYK